MIDFNLVLRSDTVILRPMLVEDLHEMKKRTGDKDRWLFFTADLSDETQLTAWIKEGIEATRKKSRLAFSMIDARTNTLFGATSFANISTRDRRLEIGWTWVARSHQGKGFNSHVKYLMLKYCFEQAGAERVECKTDVLNKPARGTLKKIGMTEEGILRSHTLMTHNRRRDTIFYSILKGEWESLKIKNGWA